MDESREIERFRKDWEIDFPKREIRRKIRGTIRRLVDFLFCRPYPVIALYRFAQSHLDSEEGMVFLDFIERTKGSSVAGVPSWFEISKEWTIPTADLKTLVLGPLVKDNVVIVPTLPKKGFLLTMWQLVGIVSTVGGAVTFIVWLFGGCRFGV